ncbi:hypothetical protein CL654_01910 [bacterium]|nr:hypothetical protein [bacterium]|tara:strand:- start:16660 stop:17103 length:444 start_codon:yes stop_codon:yes gene_type:complete
MKKIFVIAFFLVLTSPLLVYGHAGETTESSVSGFMMMRQIEDSVLGNELHEEMEGLMTKMMSGQSLTQDEISRVTSFMEEYPGPHATMMNRLGYEGYSWGTHPHYNYGHGGVGMFGFSTGFMWVTQLLFWGVLILAIVALIKWINKK